MKIICIHREQLVKVSCNILLMTVIFSQSHTSESWIYRLWQNNSENSYRWKKGTFIFSTNSTEIQQEYKSFRKNTRNCLQGHTGTVKTIAVTIDNKYVISGSWD